MRLVVTGGSGFIGSAVVRLAVSRGIAVMNIDRMTYAATAGSTSSVADSGLYGHALCDVLDTEAILDILHTYEPDAVMHLAAESHVDRSIDRPAEFISTNVVGTTSMLEAATEYFESLSGTLRKWCMVRNPRRVLRLVVLLAITGSALFLTLAAREHDAGSRSGNQIQAHRIQPGTRIVCGDNMGDIFRRNAFNLGLHLVQCPDAVVDAQDGDEYRFEAVSRQLVNDTRGKTYEPIPLSPKEDELRQSGGIFAVGRREFQKSVVTQPAIDWPDERAAARNSGRARIPR